VRCKPNYLIWKRKKWLELLSSYYFWIYSYNASVVVGYSVFQSRIKYFLFSKRARLPVAL
jgi:hypothetical protein